MQSKTLVFHHLTRTGGISLTSVAVRQYPNENMYQTSGEPEGRKFSLARFKSFEADKRDKYHLIFGHSAGRLLDYVKNPEVVFMLRNPIDRVVSLYKLVKGKKDHPLWSITQKYSLEECYKQGIYKDWTDLSNGQTASISVMLGSKLFNADKKVGRLLAVKKIVDSPQVLPVITEHFDASLMLLKKRFGWKSHIFYDKRNSSHPSFAITESLKEIIAAYNDEDIELYKYALGKFNQLKSKQSSGFDIRLVLFRQMNLVARMMNGLKRSIHGYENNGK